MKKKKHTHARASGQLVVFGDVVPVTYFFTIRIYTFWKSSFFNQCGVFFSLFFACSCPVDHSLSVAFRDRFSFCEWAANRLTFIQPIRCRLLLFSSLHLLYHIFRICESIQCIRFASIFKYYNINFFLDCPSWYAEENYVNKSRKYLNKVTKLSAY